MLTPPRLPPGQAAHSSGGYAPHGSDVPQTGDLRRPVKSEEPAVPGDSREPGGEVKGKTKKPGVIPSGGWVDKKLTE